MLFNMMMNLSNPKVRERIIWKCSKCSMSGSRTFKNHKKSCLSQSRFVSSYLCHSCFRSLPEFKASVDHSYFKSDEFKARNSNNSKQFWTNLTVEEREVFLGKLKSSRTLEWKQNLSKSISDKFRDPEYLARIKQARSKYRPNIKLTKDIFVERAIEIHGNRYDYSLVDFGGKALRNRKVIIICREHGQFEQRVGHITNGHGCPICAANLVVSKPHQGLIDFVKNNTDKLVVINDRSIGWEIDIFIPESKFGIEFNGDYFHSVDNQVNKWRHYLKANACEAKGIKLLQISEYRWSCRPHIYESMILNKLGKSTRIYARKCEFVQDGVRDFIDQNHLYGNRGSEYYLGLKYEDKIMCGISFSRHGNGFEIIRFTNLIGTVVVGGLSKLLKRFIDTHKPDHIMTFCDRMYGTGIGYLKSGFKLHHKTKPGYRYWKSNKTYARQKFQKHKLVNLLPHFDPQLTEIQNMLINGYRLLYDAGHYCFELDTKQNTGLGNV
jgi:hypothetical protein